MKRKAATAAAAVVVAAAANLTVTTSTALADLAADQTPFHSYRGLWVSRFEYANSQAGVDQVFANAQALGITDVMFQVRGAADARYTPKIVDGNYFEHKVGSFDALARAVQQGQQRGIRVHAWLNAMPLHSGTTIPADEPGNPYVINTHPEYWIRDSNNVPQPLNSSYVIVNPTMPEVKQHLYEVVDDITGKYAVDGIHLDYIRYYNDTSSSTTPLRYPTDPASVARFQAIPGNAGKTPTTHRDEYKQWMADNVTEIVAGIRQTMKDNRPDAQLTAAIWRNANIGFNGYQQEWSDWVDRGLLDAGMPMIYRKGFGSGGTNMDADSGNIYRNDVTSAVNWRGTSGIMPGLGIYMQDNTATAYNNVMAQLNFARDMGANGVQLFSYTDLLGGNSVDQEVRRAWLDFLAANNSAPPAASITDFEVDEGYFPSNITFSGSNFNVDASSTADRTTEDGVNNSTASQQITINKAGAGTFLARHVSGIGTPAHPGSNISFPSIGAIGFWLKTTADDVEVAVALDDNAANTSTERSYFQNVKPDGEWHYYEWFLNDPTHWNAWAGSPDGTIEANFTLDSIQFRGSEDVNVLLLDDVIFDAVAVAPDQWARDSAIDSHSADTNWTNSANWDGTVPTGVDAAANFLRRATGPQEVTVDAPVTLGHLTFDNANPYTLAGTGTITFDVSAGDASLTVRNRGEHFVAANVALADHATVGVDFKATLNLLGTLDNASGRTINKIGSGTLNLFGTQQHGAGAQLVAAGGTTNLFTDAGAAGAGNLILAATGADTRVNLNVTQHLASVSADAGATVALAAGGGKVLSTRAVSATGGGRIDLADNGMIVDYDSASPLADVRALLASAHNGGDWAGGGITTSTADANHGLGYGEASSLFTTFPAEFLGEDVDDTSVLVLFTRYGDSNLDGQVNLADFNALAAGFGTSEAFWTGGDFNYDGTVNLADFNLLAANFGLAASGTEVTPQDWANLAASVPEPGVIGAIGVAAVGSLVRRRR